MRNHSMTKNRTNFKVFMILSGIILSVTVLGFCQSCNFGLITEYPDSSQYISPVSILSNAELNSYLPGQTGPGDSWDNAYIIEDLQIDSAGSGPGLRVENTNLFLIIQDIFVTDSGSSAYSGGIQLTNCTNIRIQNTETTNKDNGIFVIDSTFIEILDNTANNNDEDGIHLLDSSNCTISSNEAGENPYYGITIKNSHFNTISDNKASENSFYGIYLEDSNSNYIEKNIIKNNFLAGIYLTNSDSNTIIRNTIIGNRDEITQISSTGNIIERNKTSYLLEIILSSAGGLTLVGSVILILIIRKKKRG